MNGAYVTWNKSWLLSKNTTRHCEMDGIGEKREMARWPKICLSKNKSREKKNWMKINNRRCTMDGWYGWVKIPNELADFMALQSVVLLLSISLFLYYSLLLLLLRLFVSLFFIWQHASIHFDKNSVSISHIMFVNKNSIFIIPPPFTPGIYFLCKHFPFLEKKALLFACLSMLFAFPFCKIFRAGQQWWNSQVFHPR